MNLPNIVEFPIKGTCWKTDFCELYIPLLVEDNQLIEELREKVLYLLNTGASNFAFPITIKGCSFLCCLFYDEHTIRLSSLRPGGEFFLTSLSQKKDLTTFVDKIKTLHSSSFPSVYWRLTLKTNGPQLLLDDKQDHRYKNVTQNMKPLMAKLLKKVHSYRPTVFESISNGALSLTTHYDLLRIHLLKFIAVLASLDYDHQGLEIKRILLETLRRLIGDNRKARYLGFSPLPLPILILFKISSFTLKFLPAKFVGNTTRRLVRFMARRFIAGESIEKAEQSIQSLFRSGRDVTLDQLGELVVSKKEADKYKNDVLKLIRGFSLHVKKGERNKAGIRKAHVSIKVSALCSDFKPQAFDYTYKDIASRLIPIFKEAKIHQVFINVDAEHYMHRNTVFQVVKKILLQTPELQDFGDVGFVLQAYLRDAPLHLEEIISFAKNRRPTLPIRLVKGAYWDAETIEAQALGFESPEFLNKEETDLCFRQLIFKILENSPYIQLCLASHNFTDHVFCESLRELFFEESLPIEHQCLHMTYEGLSTGMAKMNWSVRNYIPIGPLITGMAYLVRRIMENSSQVGVLTHMRSHKNTSSLKNPETIHEEKAQMGTLVQDISKTDFSDKFVNVAPVRLYVQEEYFVLKQAFKKFQKDLGKTYSTSFPLSGEVHKILSPSDESIVVGSICFANKSDVAKAVHTAHENYCKSSWADSWKDRVATLIRAAYTLLIRRGELASLVSYESGKTLIEALGDVDEAIDFLNFYARDEKRLQKISPHMNSRGTTAVIAPWNFPLAIPCGMTAAALVAGNTVILKSAEQTPLTAQVLVDIFHQAGVDKHTLIHLPGIGETIGAELVDHKLVSTVVFTGSKDVGLAIQHNVSKRMYQNQRTRECYPAISITEMGGKNGIIVTENAELDETVAGILYSAFGHAGQKCSACSRIIVSEKIKERIVERLSEAIQDLQVGTSWDFSTTINPLITKEDKKRIQDQAKEAAIEVQKYGGEVIVNRTEEDFLGNSVGPAFFEIAKERALCKNSFFQKELFGPILHLVAYQTLDEALRLFHSTDYALTGGIFSQSQDDIDYLCSHMKAGNIYVNRSITGARIAIEPFGGFQLSGTGPKAGSTYYVKKFHHHAVSSSIQQNHPLQKNSHGFTNILSIFKALESFLQISPQYSNDLYLYKNLIGNYPFLKKEYNRMIPGQISFNDNTLTNNLAIFVAFNDKPSSSTIFYLFSAFTLGIKIIVIVSTKHAYPWWEEVVKIFKGHVDLIQAQNLSESLQGPFLETIVIDGTKNEINSTMDFIFDGQCKERRVRKVLTPLDPPPLQDIDSYLKTFIYPRSFAINTMRHGAMMSVDT